MLVSTIADELYREIDQPDDVTIPAISFWLTSNIGKLNNLLDTEYVVADGEISPELSEDEKAIFKLLYMISYYTRQMNKNLGAAAYTSVMEVKEGNRTVKRTNKTDIAKTYRLLVQDLNEDLMGQILNYKMNRSDPLQIIVPNPILTEASQEADPYRDRSDSRYDIL